MMFQGFTYPGWLCRTWILNLWKRFMCPKGMHLLDEVWSDDRWYLSCDACGLEIHIDYVDWRYVPNECRSVR